MELSLANAGSGPLILALVKPFIRENLDVRATLVKVADGSISTGARLRTQHAFALTATGSTDFVAATKNIFDVWTEYGRTVTITASNFSRSSTQVSIGSLSNPFVLVEEPAVQFPDLSIGTGVIRMYKTVMVSGA